MTALLMLILVMDLDSVRREPNPERRCDLALDNASARMDAAKEALNAGGIEKMQAALGELADSVDLAYDSLAAQPHPSAKAFKRAEQRTHALLRRLDSFREAVDIDDRAQVDRVRERVSAAHDNLLNGIMKKK
jgi:hypothetical protein